MGQQLLSTKYILVKSRDNTHVHINKDLIGAVEEIPASMRSQAYLKVYVGGYHFSLDMKLADFWALVQG